MSQTPTNEAGKWRVETVLSVLSILISLGTLVFSLTYNLSPGVVQPFEPSGYAIIREINWFASDHLVIPIEWQNEGGRPVLVRHPRLILRALDDEGKETGQEYEFFLAGEYSDISSASFGQEYSVKRSFTLAPHSLSLKVLVFHIKDWWDDKGSLYNFRFASGNYRVSIAFQKDLNPERESVLFELPIYESVNNLDPDRAAGYWWDFWSID